MAKKLKTGDVKRYARGIWCDDDSKWAILRNGGKEPDGYVFGLCLRSSARSFRFDGERIARILSIGPKYVTVRISK